MKERFLHGSISFDLYRGGTGRTVYILVPRGLTDEMERWADEACQVYGASIVLVRGMDWNNDLTPWPAPGVFRKAKPFEGRAEDFLRTFSGTMVPWFESQSGLGSMDGEHGPDVRKACRTIVGISLSGLFALWAGFGCGTFNEIAAISGSFWYDGFAQWVEDRTLDSNVRRVYISLGDREKRSKDSRMSTVEDCTVRIAERLKGQTEVEYVLEENVTHFSPIVPRLERLFLSLQRPNGS